LLSFKGKIYACGNGALVKIQRWDGTSWSYVLNIDFMGMNYPISMAVYQDALFVGGDHSLSNSDTYVFKYADTAWIALPGDFQNGYGIKKLYTFQNKLIVGGSFQSISNVPYNNIAMWNGSNWQ